MQKGKASIKFDKEPVIMGAASIVGEKEGEGPLKSCFDRVEPDPMYGQDSWEAAESEFQRQTALKCLEKSGLKESDIRYLFAGDLLGQIVATSFGVQDLEIPVFGLYGACSTMGEAIMLASMTVNAGYADRVMALASSHFASAERQFRFPLAYGNQRPLSTTWTVTGCGSVIVGKDGKESPSAQEKIYAKVTGATAGKIVDMQPRDSMNMGAAMAMAAVDTILQNFRDYEVDQTYYDKIITGDLGSVGQNILFDFMDKAGHDVKGIHMDCGMTIFDSAVQDTHSGRDIMRLYSSEAAQRGVEESAFCADRRAAFPDQLQRGAECSRNCPCGNARAYRSLSRHNRNGGINRDMEYIKAFLIGGLICAAVQILMDKTKLLPGRIMVLLVVTGAVLGWIGIYEPFAEWAGAGATIPLLGFGNTLWKGVSEAVGKDGILGLFKGGFTAGSAGISGALIFGYIASLIFKPKMKG